MAGVGNKTGVLLEPHQVVIRPLVTEKGTLQSERFNAYSFAVNPLAVKADIRRAVQELWGVRVVHVRTQNRRGKPRRHRASSGYTKRWKKAVVKLHTDDRIAFF